MKKRSPTHLLKTLTELRSKLCVIEQIESTFPKSEIYLVGGAVRDLLLKRETKDYDFLVRRVPAEALGRLLRKHGKVNWVGKNFGVFKFYPNDADFQEAIDVALPRTEQSFSDGGGYRDFKITSDPELLIEDDLRRRDFTINAMAARLSQIQPGYTLNDVLIDPFDGLDDLNRGLLRAVGEPDRRFAEDSSRVLRGLRFAAQLQVSFEDATWAALKDAVRVVNAKRKDGTFVVPRETIAKEFIKAMVHDPARSFDLWDISGAFSELIPELLPMKNCPQPTNYHSEGDVWVHTRLALSQLHSESFREEFKEGFDAETVLAVLFHDIAKPVTIQTPEKDGSDRIRFNNHDHIGARMTKIIARRLKLSSFPKDSRYYVDDEALAWLIERHLVLVQSDIGAMRAATVERIFLNPKFPGEKLMHLIYCDGMATIPKDGRAEILHFHLIKERIKKIEALAKEESKLPQPLLGGRDVMNLFEIPSGPQIGKYLLLLREEQLSGKISTREAALTFLKAHRFSSDF